MGAGPPKPSALSRQTWTRSRKPRRWSGEGARARGAAASPFRAVRAGRAPAETLRLIAPDLDAESEAAELERIEVNDTDGLLEVEGALQLLGTLPEGSWTGATPG